MKLENKQELRRFFKKSRSAKSGDEVRINSGKITKRLLNLKEVFDKKNILIYLSIDKEVETEGIINGLLKKGTNIFVPFYSKKHNGWDLCEFQNWHELEKGPLGILQPKNPRVTSVDIVDLAILPGLAFSKDGVRLGYGRGVFDKLLFRSKALKVGLAYDFQVVDKLPWEKHDLMMNIVVTEKRVIRITPKLKLWGPR